MGEFVPANDRPQKTKGPEIALQTLGLLLNLAA